MTQNGYHCRSCGEYHDELPLVFGPEAPIYWYGIPEPERASRAELNADLCVIDNQHFFIRGRLEIPIRESSETFAWLVWTTLRREDFERVGELWTSIGREREEPHFGWLSTELPVYQPSTINLKTHVHTRPVGSRPFIEVEPTDHPLALDQRNGITWARVQEIAEALLHSG